MLLSIDPGVKNAGVALFETDVETGVLIWAGLVRGETWAKTAWEIYNTVMNTLCEQPRTIVIEKPQVYVQSKQRGDANDLITLALMIGATATWFSDAKLTLYLPRTWKGQVPKAVMTKRTKEKLTHVERSRIDLPRAKSLHHNIYDAIGIGLFHLRRRAPADHHRARAGRVSSERPGGRPSLSP